MYHRIVIVGFNRTRVPQADDQLSGLMAEEHSVQTMAAVADCGVRDPGGGRVPHRDVRVHP